MGTMGHDRSNARRWQMVPWGVGWWEAFQESHYSRTLSGHTWRRESCNTPSDRLLVIASGGEQFKILTESQLVSTRPCLTMNGATFGGASWMWKNEYRVTRRSDILIPERLGRRRLPSPWQQRVRFNGFPET